MQTGKKAQGFTNTIGKLCCIRHGHAPRRSCNKEERAVEREVRQKGKRYVKGDWKREY